MDSKQAPGTVRVQIDLPADGALVHLQELARQFGGRLYCRDAFKHHYIVRKDDDKEVRNADR